MAEKKNSFRALLWLAGALFIGVIIASQLGAQYSSARIPIYDRIYTPTPISLQPWQVEWIKECSIECSNSWDQCNDDADNEYQECLQEPIFDDGLGGCYGPSGESVECCFDRWENSFDGCFIYRYECVDECKGAFDPPPYETPWPTP